MIPFESMQAKAVNIAIAKRIQQEAWAASAELAELFGEPDMLIGRGRRNTTLTAYAPTKSSSFIIGQASEIIQPELSNYKIQDLQKGKFTILNPYLKMLLGEKGLDTPETWDSILANRGSVQHLAGLTQHEKDVFKTFEEIAPMEIIIQAAGRQAFIDQSQSLNLWIHPKTPVNQINKLMIEAWRMGVKSLYYQIGENAAQAFARDISECVSCSA